MRFLNHKVFLEVRQKNFLINLASNVLKKFVLINFIIIMNSLFLKILILILLDK